LLGTVVILIVMSHPHFVGTGEPMNFPKVAVGIITYNRLPLLKQVVQSMQEHINYPNLVWVLSDDGSTDGTIEWAKETGIFHSIIRHKRGGMPVNWNGMIAECERLADFTLCCQDDFFFTFGLNLELAVSFLNANPNYGFVRYHKTTGHTGLLHSIQEWDTTNHIPRFEFNPHAEYHPQMLPYFRLLPCASDVYSPYSGGTHLRHRRFTEYYGEYREGVGFSNSEIDYFIRVNKRLREEEDAPQFAMFPWFVISQFQDIGVSYRGTAIEQETLKK